MASVKTLIGNIKGPKGDQGERGLQGIQGIQGPQGIRGIQGDRGPQGIQGEKGDPGSVMTVNGTAPDETGNVQLVIPQPAQPDWNAAEGEPGHILGRTHWVESERVEVLAETTTAVSADAPAQIEIPSCPASAGDAVIVNWNGTEYTCVAQDASVVNMLGVVVGNVGAATGGTDTGEPFVVVLGEDEGTCLAMVFAMDGSTSAILSIYQDKETVHKLPGKFLPAGVPYVEQGGMVEILPETTLEAENEQGEMVCEVQTLLVAGETYTVTWNGTEYTCVAQDASAMAPGVVAIGNLADMGLTGNGEPFAIVTVEEDGAKIGMVLAVDGSTSTTIAIYQNGAEIQKLDNRCLDLEWLPVIKLTDTTLCEWAMDMPTSGTKSLLSKDYIIKMIDGEKYAVTWNGTTYERIGHAVAVTVDGFTATFYYIGNTSLSSLITAWNIDTVSMTDTGEPFLYEMLVIVTDSSCTGYLHADKNVSSTFIIKGPAPTPNKLPEVFLPESVDGIVVRSSTADSTKKFKITVDDSGTITATEV